LKISIILLTILFSYGIFSTFFHEFRLTGNIGKTVGETNIYLFGYFAYVNILILFYPLYKLYSDSLIRKSLDFYLGWILLFIALIILEALVLDKASAGFLGTQVVDVLKPYIGSAGLWFFWMMIVSLLSVFLVDESILLNMIDKSASNVSKERNEEVLAKEEVYQEEKVQEKFQEPEIYKEETLKEEEKESLKESFQKVFKNPFAPSSLESEMMPELQENEKEEILEFEPIPPVIEAEKETKKVPSVMPKSAPKKVRVQKTAVLKKHVEDDAVVQEIEELEDEMLESHSSSSVQIVSELEENSKLMEQIEKGAVAKPKNFKLPKLDFLQKAPKVKKKMNEAEIDRKIEELLSKLSQFRVDGDVVRTYSGPLVTTFEFKPAANVKVSKILGLQDDLAMALRAETIRIQAPIPGRDVVGIEIPNESIDTIYLREILESDIFKNSSSPLTVALGKDIVGNPFITDIKKLPHLLIAGTTGSGKSVGINAMILSLLYRNDPDQLKLMLIDPKMLEFAAYEDIPHLITPVITEPIKAIAALANMVGEMERRYKLMAEARTKNIENYNEKVKKTGAEPFAFIVVVIDELADLMMNGGKEVELSIARLAQKSRACGIHLVVATQRPSVDVVTGLIKANLPSRLSYRVGSRIDSKVILDALGADSLLGRGDGLFTPPGATGLVRIHAPWNTEEEIEEVVEYIKAQRVPEYDESYLVAGGTSSSKGDSEGEIELDSLFEEAKNIVLSDNKTSISYLQRKLQIGYNRSANIIEQLEAKGVLSAPNAKGNREIL
jgi:S-DNA-T family DNA segregation ATPase FtsK/SpoIIIE